jgi:hypothetical protein
MSQQEQPREQTPAYRSVKLASPPAMPPPLRSSPFAIISKPPQQQTPSTAVEVLQQSNDNDDNTKPWTLCHPLPTIPAGYMLERNQICLIEQPPQQVANRISECLHLRSFVLSETSTKVCNVILYNDDDELATSIVSHFLILFQLLLRTQNGFRAESTMGLLFRVNFFQDSNNLVIEFQRLNGCSYVFQKTFQAIHRCVIAQEGEKTNHQEELEFPTCALPMVAMTQAQKQERLLETYQIAMNMLSSKRVDCQLMGLEVLEPMSTNVDIAGRLVDTNLATLLQFCKGTMEPKSKLEQQQECLLKRRALSILANSLEALQSKSCNHDQETPPSMIILDTLLACLQNNRCGDAHQSFQIARCLVLLPKTINSHSELSRATLLLSKEQEKQDLPFLKQEYKKLEASLLLSS